ETSRDPVVPEEPVPLEDVAPVEVIPEEPVPLDPVEVSAAVEAPPAAPPAPRVDRGARRREALQRLDAVASARLAAGDAAGAEEAYRAIVRKAGQSGLAELAYGDLFTLAHGRRDRAAQQRLWREYLDDFPRGRFADDARAGLCRSLGGEPQAECWTRYLDDFPTGAYHRQAERALGRE
ncbi:MAG: hypothetical protein KDK70_39420, partial [Myxococcales bacterium]|nr:hypothetical protein [Myxococcales bacterium]